MWLPMIFEPNEKVMSLCRSQSSRVETTRKYITFYFNFYLFIYEILKIITNLIKICEMQNNYCLIESFKTL